MSASAAPAWWRAAVAEAVPPRELVETHSARMADEVQDVDMARRRWIDSASIAGAVSPEVQHAARIHARMGSGLGVELPDGRRGNVVALYLPPRKRAGEDAPPATHTALGRGLYSKPDPRELVTALVAVGVGAGPTEAWRDGGEGGQRVVLVEVERVRIPEPASGVADLGAWMEERRAAAPRARSLSLATLARALAPRGLPKGKPGKVGAGSLVTIHGDGARGVVLGYGSEAGRYLVQVVEPGPTFGEVREVPKRVCIEAREREGLEAFDVAGGGAS